MYSLHPELAVNRRCCPPLSSPHCMLRFACFADRSRLSVACESSLSAQSIPSTLQRRITSPATSLMTRPRRSFPLSARRGLRLLCPTTGQNFNSVRCSCTSPSLTQLSTRHFPSQHLHSPPLLLTHSIQISTHVSCWCRHLLHHTRPLSHAPHTA